LQISQHGAGSGQSRGRQFDLKVREQVPAVGLDPCFLQRLFDAGGDAVQAAAVQMVRQLGDVGADGGYGRRSILSAGSGGGQHGLGTGDASGLKGIFKRGAHCPDGDISEIQLVLFRDRTEE